MNEPAQSPPPEDLPPPILGRWKNMYLLVLGELVLLVLVFYAITRWAS